MITNINLSSLSTPLYLLRYNFSTVSNNSVEFLKWFTGFSDAEASFSIIPKFNADRDISSFSFMFAIRLHIDDIEVLNHIKKNLGIGNVRTSGDKECVFTVTNKEGINYLISIFDKYNLNTTKFLDYLDFKQAYTLYNNRQKELTEILVDDILSIKNKMNTQRIDFTMPHEVNISNSWLLGFIEGDGSFNFWRNDLLPVFSIALSDTQQFLLLKIKEFLVQNLGFDDYSKY